MEDVGNHIRTTNTKMCTAFFWGGSCRNGVVLSLRMTISCILFIISEPFVDSSQPRVWKDGEARDGAVGTQYSAERSDRCEVGGGEGFC